jgi:hypothetical protein
VQHTLQLNRGTHPGPCRSPAAAGASASATTVQQAAAAPVTQTAPRRTPLSSMSLRPVPGAQPTPLFGAALRGSPEPLGATYDKELVRALRGRRMGWRATGRASGRAQPRCAASGSQRRVSAAWAGAGSAMLCPSEHLGLLVARAQAPGHRRSRRLQRASTACPGTSSAARPLRRRAPARGTRPAPQRARPAAPTLTPPPPAPTPPLLPLFPGCLQLCTFLLRGAARVPGALHGAGPGRWARHVRGPARPRRKPHG